MGIGFMLDGKWVFSTKSPFLANSSTRQNNAPYVRGREICYESARLSTLYVSTEENEKDILKSYTGSFGAHQSIESGLKEVEERKMDIGKGLQSTLYNPDDDIRMRTQDYASTSYSSLPENKKSHFGLLKENLEKIEETFVNEDLVRLERDILIQLGKLGALKLFQACLSQTLATPTMSIPPLNFPREFLVDGIIDDQVIKTVHSGRREERRSRREKASEKATKVSLVSSSSKAISKVPRWGTGSAAKNLSNTRSKRLITARHESDMSMGVKDVANLERIRTTLEKESGCMASFRSWAKAAGVDEKVLQQRLHYGWCCRDKLLRSTHPLVVYLARNYRGLGISSEDLVQAGNMGVIKGAERFDHTRGYQFSTYVQYWIRKSMSDFVTQHSREIQIPIALSRAINRIQKARRALYNLHGRYPDDDEIARFTGLSVAKIIAASKCPRIVGSIDQRIGDSLGVKIMELMSDTSIENPEETVMRQHMRKDMYDLLRGLYPRERQVLVLRHGLWDGRCRSLEEIGRLCKCTKEWIRKIEKSALTKLRKELVQKKLSQYLNF